jgi:hypothetical protein
MGISCFAHVHFICEMRAGPFQANSFEPTTAFEAETCSCTVKSAFIPSVAMVKNGYEENYRKFLQEKTASSAFTMALGRST